MFIINALKKLKKLNRIYFTTPAHLQCGIIPDNLKDIIGETAFNNDFSEFDGLDNLKNPQNCILKSQNKASKIYNTKATFYLTNGSSSGILAIMLTILKHNDKVLIARNAHESIFNALVLTGACPIWFLPDYDEKFDIAKGITLQNIERIYKQNNDIKALIITSPTYEGSVSEIHKISKFCQKNNIIFIVDEAHGALFPFSDKLPDSAINLGADACVQSLHKNTPALNGSALLHIGKNSSIKPDEVQKNLNLITTTSPSWLQIASIEGSIEFLNSQKGEKEIEKLLTNIDSFKNKVKNFEYLSNDDPTKLLISHEGFSGSKISNYLDQNNVEDELVTQKAVLCLCGIGTTKQKLNKLANILKRFKQNKKAQNKSYIFLTLPTMKLTPKEAWDSPTETIHKENSEGRIIAENITPYPPCVPVLMAGEVIEKKHFKYLGQYIKVIKN